MVLNYVFGRRHLRIIYMSVIGMMEVWETTKATPGTVAKLCYGFQKRQMELTFLLIQEYISIMLHLV